MYDLDLSEKMVRVARARLRARGFAGEVVVECGDAARLPYETDFFDAIFMSFTLELFDTPEIPLISTSV